jgi:mRNA interferase RelE/StbE
VILLYSITFSPVAKKQFDKLEPSIQERITNSLERIRINPKSYLTKLVGDEGYKFRVGDHRLIIDLEHKNLLIIIIKVGHRKNVYES